MKQLLFTVCTLLLTLSLSAQVKKTYHDNGKIKSEAMYKNGVANGYWKEYTDEGVLRVEGNKKNGQRNGLWTTFFKSNGKKYYTQQYKNGKREGTYQRYRTGGSLSEEGQYKNGQREGKWISYDADGLVRSESNYKNGKRHGIYRRYHAGSESKIREQGNYEYGKANGDWTTYYSNGNKEKVYNYVNGKIVGKTKRYTVDGKLKQSSNYIADLYKDGPSKNRAVNYKVYMLTEHPTQVKNLKSHLAHVVENKSIEIGPYKTFTYSKLKSGKDYLFYIICENTGGYPTVKVNGNKQSSFYKSNKEITKGDDKCKYYYAKKKGVSGARVTFNHSVNTKAQFVLIEQDPAWKKKTGKE